MVADNERLASSLHWTLFHDLRGQLVTQIDTPEMALAMQQHAEYTTGHPSQTYRNMTSVRTD